jgi:hypothetical protein
MLTREWETAVLVSAFLTAAYLVLVFVVAAWASLREGGGKRRRKR